MLGLDFSDGLAALSVLVGELKKKPPAGEGDGGVDLNPILCGRPCGRQRLGSDRAYVRRFRTFAAWTRIKLDLLTFLKRAKALRGNAAVVYEVVFATFFWFNESKALLIAEPFYCTCYHCASPFVDRWVP